MECSCPSGGGIRNGHNPSYAGVQKERKSNNVNFWLEGFARTFPLPPTTASLTPAPYHGLADPYHGLADPYHGLTDPCPLPWPR